MRIATDGSFITHSEYLRGIGVMLALFGTTAEATHCQCRHHGKNQDQRH